MRKTLSSAFLLVLILVLSSCSSVRLEEGGDDTEDMKRLQRQLVAKPNDPESLRDLGIIYFKRKQFESAKANLFLSYSQVANDPRTIFYYGMTLEYIGDLEGALRVYIEYTDVPAESRYRKLIEGRYRTVTREIVQQQLRKALADEQKLGTESVSPKAVAVFPLVYQGTDQKYEALGMGLSEMMLIDLGQVKSLQVLERIRIEALLEELQFGQSAMVDKATAPRLGKLLSAGRVVSGTFNVNNYNLRMDVAAWDILQRKFPDPTTKSDELDNLFKMEKELVFGIIRELGITLTPEERDRIQFVPTRNTFAFINYCLGLKSEEMRDFRAARVYYNEAATYDPGFALAKVKLQAVESLIVAGGPKENAVLAAEELEAGKRKAGRQSQSKLLTDRLRNLGVGVGSTFTSGEDSRKSAQEAERGGAGVSRLPEPPPPPVR
jgi:tetratricopeptide (TPR) repeat protein